MGDSQLSSFAAQPRYRSGVAARLAGVPVATLRIWERRYSVVAPPQTASGHRLYSDEDVERLTLLRELADQGHSIGTIAALDVQTLRQMAQRNLPLPPNEAWMPAAESSPRLRVVMVDRALAHRCTGARFRRALAGTVLEVAAVHDTLEQAQAALAVAGGPLVWVARVGSLQPDDATRLARLATRPDVKKMVVLYGFAAGHVLESLADTGVELARDPVPDKLLVSMLQGREAATAGEPATAELALSPEPRFSLEALEAFASRSNTVQCECPRHVAELLMQLSHFERYSRDCAHRSPDDAALHAMLARTSAAARTLFEAALERVAQAEGLPLGPVEAAA